MFVFIESHARAINNSRCCLEKRATWTTELWNGIMRCGVSVELESIFHSRRLFSAFFCGFDEGTAA